MNYQSDMQLGTVALNITNLKRAVDFYKNTLGLTVLSENENYTDLGISEDTMPLIRLVEGATNNSNTDHAGLYHVAILLPTREALAQFVYHMATNNFEIGGAGDHLYSEAFYLNDPDGNGIEIYADRPYDTWDISESGMITSATNAVDVNDLLTEIKEPFWDGMPKGTIVGHVHLQVSDIAESRKFYHEILNFDIKTLIPRALFMSRGLYHHQIATNNWIGHQLDLRLTEDVGLIYYTMIFDNREQIIAKLVAGGYTINNKAAGVFVVDPNGITIKLEQSSKRT